MTYKQSNDVERVGVAIAMKAFHRIGFAFREQPVLDQGVDAHAELVQSEKATGKLLGVQPKSGPSHFSKESSGGYVFRTNNEHVEYWVNHALPVLICLCDTDSATVYWQVATRQTIVSTGIGFKITIPRSQTVSESSYERLLDLLTPIASPDQYTVFHTVDVSHSAAKRYAYDIVLNGSLSKAQVAAVVRQATRAGREGRYHRNQLVAGMWGNSDAHVVTTFVFPTAEDQQRRNYACRSMWVDESLEQQNRPIKLSGEHIGDGVVVDWSGIYLSNAKHVSANTLSKEAYLSSALPAIDTLETALKSIDGALAVAVRTDEDDSAFAAATETSRNLIDEVHSKVCALSYAPFECNEAHRKLHELLATLHNICVFYAPAGVSLWNAKARVWQTTQSIAKAKKLSTQLRYELEKIY